MGARSGRQRGRAVQCGQPRTREAAAAARLLENLGSADARV